MCCLCVCVHFVCVNIYREDGYTPSSSLLQFFQTINTNLLVHKNLAKSQPKQYFLYLDLDFTGLGCKGKVLYVLLYFNKDDNIHKSKPPLIRLYIYNMYILTSLATYERSSAIQTDKRILTNIKNTCESIPNLLEYRMLNTDFCLHAYI